MNVRRSVILKIVLTLCVVAQSVAVFPHHHHYGSEVPCFDIFESSGGRDLSHGHHDRECSHHAEESCRINALDITQPQDEQTRAGEPCPADVHGAVCGCRFTVEDRMIFDTMLSRESLRSCPPVEHAIIVYISLAHSTRAPSVLV